MNHTHKIVMVLLVLLSAVFLGATLKIDGISISKTEESSKLYGSVFGGTAIYIKGTGFSPDASKNTVMVGDFKCDIPSEGVTDATLACQTGSTGEYKDLYNQPITITADGSGTVTAQKTFDYLVSSTPFIKSIYPAVGFGGELTYWDGYHQILKLGDGKSDSDILGMYIGNSVCSRFDIIQDDFATTKWGDFIQTTIPMQQKAGIYTTRQHVVPGNSYNYPTMQRGVSSATADDSHEFAVLPAIKGFTESGAARGNTMVIDGTGFSPVKSDLKVSVDGVNCEVQASSYDKITCKLEEKTTQSSQMQSNIASPTSNWESGAGFQYERYDITKLAKNNPGYLKGAIQNFRNGNDNGELKLIEAGIRGEIKTGNIYGFAQYAQVWRGYFIPKTDGPHTFRAVGDDAWTVFITNETYNSTVAFSNTTISSTYGQSNENWPNYYQDLNQNILEATLEFTAYNRYYMEVYHLNRAGGSSFELGVEIPNTDTTVEKWQSYEVHMLEIIQSTQVEIVRFTVSGAGAGTLQMKIFQRDSQLKVIYNNTVTVAYNVSAWDFCKALRGLKTFGDYDPSCTRQLRNSNDEVVTDASAAVSYVYDVSLSKLRPDDVRDVQVKAKFSGNSGSNPTFTVTKVQEHGGLVSGDFTLELEGTPLNLYDSKNKTFNGTNFPFDVSANDLQQSIRQLKGLQLTEIVENGQAGYSKQWIIYYIGYNGNLNLKPQGSRLQGQATMKNTVRRAYSPNLLIEPLDYRFMSTPASEGGVHVEVNGINSVCQVDGGCAYNFLTNEPQISSAALSGDQLSLSLTTVSGLSYELRDIQISLGDRECSNLQGTPNSFTCTLSGGLTAGDHIPVVEIASFGFVKMASGVNPITQELSVSQLSLSQGGNNGGYPITVTGAGFPSSLSDSADITFKLCNQNAKINSLTNTEAVIVVPQCQGSTTTQNLFVTYNSLTNSDKSFTYQVPTANFQITGINPSSASPVLKQKITISGSGFGTDKGVISVFLSNDTGRVYELKVLKVSDNQIQAGLSGGLQGSFELNVVKSTEGNAKANPETANDFAYEVVVNSISPNQGSINGGTLIQITGKNFIAGDKADSMVTIGNQLNQLCAIQSITSTSIFCRTPAKHPDEFSNTPYQVIVNNKLIIDSTCSGDCTFKYSDDASASATSLSTKSLLEGELTITGERFDLDGIADCKVVLSNRITQVETVYAPSSCTATQATVTLPSLQSGYYLAKVRTGTKGDSNGLAITIGLELQAQTSPAAISIHGGQISVNGKGLPDTWPNSHYSKLSLAVDGKNLELNVISTNPYQTVLTVPAGSNGRQYNFSITNIQGQTKSVMFSQTTAATPTAVLDSSTPVSPGVQNQVVLSSDIEPSQVTIFSTSNPAFEVSVPNSTWTFTNGKITFKATLKSGRYGFKLYSKIQGGYTCESTLDVTKTGDYEIGTAQQVSFNGGQATVTGTDIGQGSTLTVNGKVGTYISSIPTGAIFSVPALLTPMSQQSFSLRTNQTINLKDKLTLGDTGSADLAFDGDYQTIYSSNAAECTINVDIGENLGVVLTRIRYFPYSSWAQASNYINGGKFQSSKDNVNWNDLAEVDKTVHAGWNSIMIDNDNMFRYFRFIHNSSSKCKIAEIELTGFEMSTVEISSIDSFSSDAVFNDGLTTQTFTGAIQYRDDRTPIITDVSPDKGDVFGGYPITLTGQNLDIGEAQVVIDGKVCVVDTGSSTATEITCQVAQRLQLPEQQSFAVRIGSSDAIIRAEFRYVLRWSDPRTWGLDLPPVQGDLVYVPKGMHLLMDESTPILKGIVAQNGILEFADQKDMIIQAETITLKGGKFIAGTEKKPYQNKLRFVMHGDYHDAQLPLFGNKGIGCFQCDFSMQGIPRKPTWTDLAATVNIGETQFTVIDEVDWQAGEEIAIASTSYDHNEAEQRTIQSVSADKRTITVTKPFKFLHYSGSETHGNDTLTMRAEVALLTRNIQMMGDDTSIERDYGSHLMLAGSSENGLVGKIAYTEFTKCGQPAILGRYCHHFHMNGDVPNSYSIGNSVHQSMARILTLHGVHFLTVRWNVGYRVHGHNFFIEDGIETNNVLEYNLAIGSLSSNNMLQTDVSVASYWITNPTNHLRFNRAAGGDFYGFWYEIKPRPDGPSSTQDICPEGNVLGESHDNIAHSNRRFGLRIFRMSARQNPCMATRNGLLEDPFSENPSIESRFYNYVLFKNGEAGLLAEKTGHTLFENFIMAENSLGGMEFWENNYTREDVTVRNATIIGVSLNNPDTNMSNYRGNGAIMPRSGNLRLENVRFYNYKSTQNIYSVCAVCGNVKTYTNDGSRYFGKQIQYNNVNGTFYKMIGLRREIFYDQDGSVTNGVFDQKQRTSATLVNNWEHIAAQPECVSSSEPKKWDQNVLCDGSLKVVQVAFKNVQKHSEFDGMPIHAKLLSNLNQKVDFNQTTNRTTAFSLQKGKEPKYQHMFSYNLPYVAGHIYSIWWSTGIDFQHFSMDTNYLFKDESMDGILFKFQYTDNRQLYEIGPMRQGVLPTQADLYTSDKQPLTASNCNNGQFYHTNSYSNRMLQLCASARGKTQFELVDVTAVYCRDQCPETPEQGQREKQLRYWSNPNNWPEGRLPAEGENVTIQQPWRMILDVNELPAFDMITINGELTIQDDSDLTIQANNIWINVGVLRAGNSSSQPFTHQLTFQINGNKQTRGFTVDEGLTGNKMIVVTGDLALYGVSPATTYTRLTAFARPGDKEIQVVSAKGWEVGGQLGIAPSFSNPVEFQKVKITAINNNTISFTPALQYKHYGSTDEFTVEKPYGTLDTRASVVYLTRNIKFTNGENNGGYGFTLTQYGYVQTIDDDNQKIHTGNMNISGVEFIGGGQYDSQVAALTIVNVRLQTNNSLITKNSFHQCMDFCITLNNVKDVNITHNTLYNARKYHVLAQRMNATVFSQNTMIGVTVRPSESIKDLIACVNSYKSFDIADQVDFRHNLCQGSEGHGYVVPTLPCAGIDEYPFQNNTIGSAQLGFILSKSQSTCEAANGLRAYACKIGHIQNPTTNQVSLKHFIMVDNQRGAGLRIGGRIDIKTVYMNDSYFSAVSRPECTECYGEEATICDKAYALRLFNTGSNAETLPEKFGQGFDIVCNAETIDAKAFLYNVEFQNYRSQFPNYPDLNCSDIHVFQPHPGASDMTGSHHLFNSTCVNCEQTAWARFTPPDLREKSWIGGCGQLLCTGMNNYIIHDHTGGFLGSKSLLLANNSWIGQGQAACTLIPDINGYHCANEDFAVLQYENVAFDHNTRQMWPAYLTYEGGSWTSETNAWKEWDWIGPEPQNKRKGRFVSIVKLHETYNMTFAAKPPTDMRLDIQKRIPGGNASDWVIVKLHYPEPSSIRVQIGNKTIKPISLLDGSKEKPLNTSQCGSNKFFYDNYTIHFVVTGSSECSLRVSLVDSVQLTARFSMPLDDFFANDGATKFINRMAALLSITDVSRIKIVGIYKGSTIIKVVVEDERETQEYPQPKINQQGASRIKKTSAIISELQASGKIAQAMSEPDQDGSPGLGPIQSFEAKVIFVKEQQVAKGEESSTGLIIGIVMGSVIFVLVALVAGVFYMRKRAKITQDHSQDGLQDLSADSPSKADQESVSKVQKGQEFHFDASDES